jgi:16S rRNA processing protein RimM
MPLPVGRVGRPHGLDGSFHVQDAREGAWSVGLKIQVGELPAVVVGLKGTAADPLVRLDVTPDREAADALRGRRLVVPDVETPALGDDEYAAEDLEGCVVADGDRELGTVRRLVVLPSVEALELDDGRLVPLVRDCVRSVDVAAKRIDIDEGFLGAA